MICLLSPAKTIDCSDAQSIGEASRPIFLSEAEYLAKKLSNYSMENLESLMSINPSLAKQAKERADIWNSKNHTPRSKPASMAFKGAVYRGLDAPSLSLEDLTFAQKHIRIISGLYGILRPMDQMQPYRLEMGLKWQVNENKKNLYDFWENRLANHVAKFADGCIVNLASLEYSKAVIRKESPTQVITPHFKDEVNGTFKSLMTYAKEARGQMARFIIQKRIQDPANMREFNGMGYTFNAHLSTDNDWFFTRNNKQ